jgi:hypothetical protein
VNVYKQKSERVRAIIHKNPYPNSKTVDWPTREHNRQDNTQRNLTLLGKSVVIKSLLISQLTFLMSVLPSPPLKYLETINSVLFKFLWNAKPDKIKRNVLFNTKQNGGLGLIHLPSQNDALKIAWVKRYISPKHIRWKQFFDIGVGMDVHEFLSCNLHSADAEVLLNRNTNTGTFVKDIYISWFRYSFEPAIDDHVSVSNQPLWYNSFIKIDGKVVFYPNWYENGIKTINDLTVGNAFMSYAHFVQQYNITTNFLIFYGVLSAIPTTWKRFIQHNNDGNLEENRKLNDLANIEKVCRHVYPYIASNVVQISEKPKLFWSTTFNTGISDEDWVSYFRKMYTLTTCPKLLYFNFRLLHNILPTNCFLYKIGLIASPECTFCKQDIETKTHLFIDCEFVKIFWDSFEKWMKTCFVDFIKYQALHLLLGNIDTQDTIIDLLYLIAKQYIYSCREAQYLPNQTGVIKCIKKYRIIEENIAKKNDKLEHFLEKWRGCT